MNIVADRPQKVTEPKLRMDPISGERYTSKEWFHREWKQMWMRTWQIAGMACHASEPGDYLVADLGPESILIIRQDDGRFRAFFNVCPHRGTRVLSGPDGYAERITCPYHGWQFDRAGNVVAVPSADDFKQGDPCDKLRLAEVRCE